MTNIRKTTIGACKLLLAMAIVIVILGMAALAGIMFWQYPQFTAIPPGASPNNASEIARALLILGTTAIGGCAINCVALFVFVRRNRHVYAMILLVLSIAIVYLVGQWLNPLRPRRIHPYWEPFPSKEASGSSIQLLQWQIDELACRSNDTKENPSATIDRDELW